MINVLVQPDARIQPSLSVIVYPFCVENAQVMENAHPKIQLLLIALVVNVKNAGIMLIAQVNKDVILYFILALIAQWLVIVCQSIAWQQALQMYVAIKYALRMVIVVNWHHQIVIKLVLYVNHAISMLWIHLVWDLVNYAIQPVGYV